MPRNKFNQGGKTSLWYSENGKTLKKEIEENTNNWRHIPCSWIGRINIIIISTLPKVICRFNAILTKISMAYYIYLEQIFQKFVGTAKNPI